jgi:hypothetical protein
MSSFFDEASLVMIPSGYKNQKVYSVKPLDGSGDLTFSRASSATRVASNGLIEKVRTNLLLQSNTLNTTWTNPNVSVTGGQTDPDGGLTAWLITETTDGGSLRQAVTATGSLTFSFTLKANTGSTSATLFCTDASQQASFDLSAGTFSESGATAKMVSLGNGWWRCSISFTASGASTLILFPSSGVAVGSTFAYEAQLETGDIATDYIATTTAAVSVGPVSGLPRLDYLNSSCPRLLLEPQRTNSWVNSENASSWVAFDINTTSNSITSPDGNQSADTVTSNTNSSFHVIGSENISFTSGTTYSSSIFVKANTGRYVQLLAGGSSFDNNSYANFDLQTGTVTFTGSSATAKIVSYGNGWYRCEISASAASTANDRFYFGVITTATAARGEVHTTALSYYVWGGQTEAGAYATSYIPTLGTSVTRVAEVASKTGISSLIGQTEGTLFASFVDTESSRIIAIGDGTTNNRLFLLKNSNGTVTVFLGIGGSGIFFVESTQTVISGSNKIAVRYKSGDTKLYLNGLSAISITNTFTISSMPNLYIGTNEFGASNEKVNIQEALVFKTALTDAQLAELTA